MKFFPPNSLELTIALIKPHAIKVPPTIENIKHDILNNKFFIIRYKRCLLDKKLATDMYSCHKGKSFYPRLIENMISGPIEIFLLAHENCITKWREMMGLTRPYEAFIRDPLSLRGLYGISNTRNATHGSDSPQSVERECSIFFPNFNFTEWYKDEEIYFRNGYVKFDEINFIHVKEINDCPKLFC